jgi:hypothetical protein
MPNPRLLVPVILAVMAGLAFTSWVGPGTSGGFLLMLAVSSGVFLLVITAAAALRPVAGRLARALAVRKPTFTSQRPGTPPAGTTPQDPPDAPHA